MKWRVGFLTVVVVFYALLYAFGLVINRPRPHAPSAQNAPTPVLVAEQFIPKGTPGTVIAVDPMYAPTMLPKKELEDGAILDPQWLRGREAAVDIFPRQQFTESDFMPRQFHDAGHGG